MVFSEPCTKQIVNDERKYIVRSRRPAYEKIIPWPQIKLHVGIFVNRKTITCLPAVICLSAVAGSSGFKVWTDDLLYAGIDMKCIYAICLRLMTGILSGIDSVTFHFWQRHCNKDTVMAHRGFIFLGSTKWWWSTISGGQNCLAPQEETLTKD